MKWSCVHGVEKFFPLSPFNPGGVSSTCGELRASSEGDVTAKLSRSGASGEVRRPAICSADVS